MKDWDDIAYPFGYRCNRSARLTCDGELPAAPVSALYVQGRVHHIGVYLALEDQMVSFTVRRKRDAQDPPARVAALVWALTELVVGNQPPRAKGVWLSGRPL